MSTITLECDVTEYTSLPHTENITNVFSMTENALLISFCDADLKVLQQSEISKNDAIELANMIFLKYK